MTTPAGFGDYDREAEDEAIHRQPPAAVGNPGTGSVMDRLKAKFDAADKERNLVVKAENNYGMELYLKIDLTHTSAELAEYRERSLIGTRAERRAGEATLSRERMAANLVVEKTVAIYMTRPPEGVAERDDDGDLLTLKSVEWITALGHPEDSVQAAIDFFGPAYLGAVSDEWSARNGYGKNVEVVDPTPVSSGG